MTNEPPKQLGNPNIADIGKDTRFGADGGADPVEAASTSHSVRKSIRRMVAAKIDSDVMDGKKKITGEIIAREIFGNSKKELSFGEALAARKIQLALAGNARMMKEIEDSVDGKLVEKKVETTASSLAELINAAEQMEKEAMNERATEGGGQNPPVES